MVRTYYHQPGLYSASQGDTQVLPGGNEFIGWGQSSYYSEYAPAGNSPGHGAANLLYDALMPGSDISYRTFRQAWTGLPYYPPSIAVQARRGRVTLYASWNGSTRTAAWDALAGPGPQALTVVSYRRRHGFQTAVTTGSGGPYFQVRALSATGAVLGASRVVKLSR